MNRKFFTLIFGDQVAIAPGEKIIPAEQFSILQDAQEVLERVKLDAENYRLQVGKETEEIKEHGFKEGYEEGFKEWSAALTSFETQLKELHLELQKLILPIAMTAAKKIVGREIELSETTIVDIVLASLKSVAQHKKITVFVNPKDLSILESQKPRLKELFEQLESLSIRPREDISLGGCVIETEIGIINARMEQRWLILEKAFEKLLKTVPQNSEETKGS